MDRPLYIGQNTFGRDVINHVSTEGKFPSCGGAMGGFNSLIFRHLL